MLDVPGEGISKVDRWLMSHNARLCFDSLGMCAENFVLLCDQMRADGMARDTMRIPLRLRVAITLFMMRKGLGYRTLQDVFHVALSTISLQASLGLLSVFDRTMR